MDLRIVARLVFDVNAHILHPHDVE